MNDAYDSKCYDLAAEFLAPELGLFTEKNNVALAQAIQATIEDWLTNARDNYDGDQP